MSALSRLTGLLTISLYAFAVGNVDAAVTVRVFAAASLTDALKEIASNYKSKAGDRILFNFGASNFLARQIEEGAPADIFFSADEAKMDGLEKKGLLLSGTRKRRLSIVDRAKGNGLARRGLTLLESVALGSIGFMFVSVAGFAPWPLAGRALPHAVGEVGLYAACAVVFIGLSGVGAPGQVKPLRM